MIEDLTKLFSVGDRVKVKTIAVEGLWKRSKEIIINSNYTGTITDIGSQLMHVEFKNKGYTAKLLVNLDLINLGSIEFLRHCPHILQRMCDCQEEQGNKRTLLPFINDALASEKYGGFDWHNTKEGSSLWSDILLFPLEDDLCVNPGYYKDILNHIKYDSKAKRLVTIDLGDIEDTYKEDPIQDNNINLIKPNQHEIRLQKPHSAIIRGTVPKGNRVCTRKHKVAISSGHLSYTTCSFRG